MKLVSRKDYRVRRRLRLRQSISGTADRPRMCVSITNKHMYVQFVDDDKGVTLAAVSTQSPDAAVGKNVAGATQLGQSAAAAAQAKGIQRVVFDRGGRKFHGRVKAIAEAARAQGLQF